MADIVPKEALAYLKNKNLKVGFSYKDVWHEEHATAFTVAKAMQLDVLADLHTAVVDAMEKGQSFESFKKNIAPVLQEKGWWGKKEMTDLLTGETVNAQLGSDRRLKTIYRVNMRSAYQKGQYERTMESDLHPYLMYRIGPSIHHREDHKSWDGLILPKDDPWWDSHFPPNGWGCKCYTRAVTEARKKQYEENGIPTAPRLDGTGGGNVPAKTQAPPVKYKSYFNERKGTVEQVPDGVDPAFNWNQAKSRNNIALQKLEKSKRNYEKAAGVKLVKLNEDGLKNTPDNKPEKFVLDEKKIAQALHKAEMAIKDLDHEEGDIIGLDGNHILHVIGKDHEVAPPPELVKDNIFTHNHPSGGCALSAIDIESIIKDDGYGVRAVTRDGRFAYLRKGDGELDKGLVKDMRKVGLGGTTLMIHAGGQAMRKYGRNAKNLYDLIIKEAENMVNKWLLENASKYSYIFTQGVI